MGKNRRRRRRRQRRFRRRGRHRGDDGLEQHRSKAPRSRRELGTRRRGGQGATRLAVVPRDVVNG